MTLSADKPILVTGGAGFIGSHLVERLLLDGHRVVVVDDFSTGSRENLRTVLAHERLRVVQSTVSACGELKQLAASAQAIFHLAAAVGVERVLAAPVESLHTNLHETEAVLEAAAAAGVPFLFTSSSEVYGKSAKPEFAEEDDLLIGPPHLLRWSYACSKLMDEFLALAYAREHRLPVVIARVFNTAGPRQTGRYGMVLPRFVAAARAGHPLRVHGDGSQTRCFCHVRDTVEALVRLVRCEAARGQVFNVGSTAEISILSLARLVIEVLGSSSSIERVPYAEAYPAGFEDMARRRPRIAKLAGMTGFQPAIPLRTLIEETAAAAGDYG